MNWRFFNASFILYYTKGRSQILSFYFIYIVLFSENLVSTCTIENSNGKKHTGVIYEVLNNLTIFNYVLLFQRC